MKNATPTFFVADEVLALGVRGVYLHMSGLQNREADPDLDRIINETVAQIREELTSERIDKDPVLAGFRRLHETVGVSNRKNVASPENLLSMLLGGGRLPRINLLVDIYNLVSIQTRLALGAHDTRKLDGNVRLAMTTGREAFWPLGSSGPKPVREGAYAYMDDSDDVICYLEVRQVEKTKVTTDSTDCFYIIQGNENTSPDYLRAASDQLISLTTRFCGGQAHVLFAS
jgi:DNA/RNA-binding domain of Phe-tRNA-synthetase-like protein